MSIEIFEENIDALPEYETVSIAFEVKSVFRVQIIGNGLSGINLIEESVEKPYVKDYDALEDERPSNWGKRFDVSNWGILTAFDNGKRIGGAAVAWKTPELFMLEGREALACLWDLRVAPDFRGKAVGHFLFERSIEWVKSRNCRQIKVETQNINVPACRFYARQGCELGLINRFAYPSEMNEIQLGWYRNV